MNDVSPESLPALSVIVVARNAASTIARALNSLAAQHYPNLELIVWDGLSTDGTLNVLKQFGYLITVLKSESDNGPPDAANRARTLATGDYVGFLNADDTLEPGALWAVADAVTRQPDAEVISFGMLYRNENEKIIGHYASEKQLALTLETLLSDTPTFQTSRFIKRDVLEELGPFNTDRSLWYYSNDREFMLRLMFRGCKHVVIPKALYGFTLHDGGLSSDPGHFARIVEEHAMMGDMLLERLDLSDAQRGIIKHWQQRYLVFGFWKALARLELQKVKNFMQRGICLTGWRFIPSSLYWLIAKLLKRFGLKLSNGIDRGVF